MPINLDIQERLKNGARSNLFHVEIPFMGENFKFFCKSAQIPASTVGIIRQKYLNREIVLTGDRTYEEWDITVLCDADYTAHKRFREWSEIAHGHGSQITGGQPEDYKFNGRIFTYKRNTDVISSEYLMVGMIPQNITPIALSWDNSDEIATFDVTIAYDWHELVS